jgi:hypothetical protein
MRGPGLKFFNTYRPNEVHKGDMMSVAAKIFPKARALRDLAACVFAALDGEP